MSRFLLLAALIMAFLPAAAQAGCFNGGQVILRRPALAPVPLQYVPQGSCPQPISLPASAGYGCSDGQVVLLRERVLNGRVVQPALVPFHRSRLRLLLGF